MSHLLPTRCCRARLSLVSLLIIVTLAFPQAAVSDEDSKASARLHYKIATRNYDIREYDKALIEFKAAYLAEPDPAFLFNIGQCYRKLGQNSDALSFFQQYLKKAPLGDPNRRQVEARIRDIESETKLRENVPQAESPSPPPTTLHEPAKSGAGAGASPGASLEPSPFPVNPSPPPPGPPAAVLADQTASVHSLPSHPGRGLRIGGIAAGAAGLGSIAVGMYYYSRAKSLSDQVTRSAHSPASDDQAGRDAVTKQWVFYSVGAAALAGGAVLYWLGWRSADAGRTTATIAPLFGPGLAGIATQGAF
jgi:tetratricopeptide (TPR) repeat protein